MAWTAKITHVDVRYESAIVDVEFVSDVPPVSFYENLSI